MLKAANGQKFENNFASPSKSTDTSEKAKKQEVGDGLSVCVLNLLPKVKFSDHKSCESGHIRFLKDSVALRVSQHLT